MRFVFLTEGNLFLKEEGKDVSEIESPFALARKLHEGQIIQSVVLA